MFIKNQWCFQFCYILCHFWYRFKLYFILFLINIWILCFNVSSNFCHQHEWARWNFILVAIVEGWNSSHSLMLTAKNDRQDNNCIFFNSMKEKQMQKCPNEFNSREIWALHMWPNSIDFSQSCNTLNLVWF